MPIYLPPLSRRGFLAKLAAAGAGMALGPEVLADTRALAPNCWALLSDTHVAADRKRIARGVNMTEHLEKVSRQVLDLPERPAGVVVTGDCAFNSGQLGDYRVFTSLLEPMRLGGMPVHLTLGNHDSRRRFWEVLPEEKRAKRPLADRQVAFLSTPAANWFILDSLEQTDSTPGLLGQEQLDWLARALDAHKEKPALVLLHHNPGITGNLGLKDSVALFDIIRPRRQVKAYIFGHTHVWRVTQDDSGIHLVNLPPVAYVFEQGEPSGWVNARIEDAGMRLELRCIDPLHKAHGQKVELRWRKA